MDQKGECHGMQSSHTDAKSLHLIRFCLLHDNKSPVKFSFLSQLFVIFNKCSVKGDD